MLLLYGIVFWVLVELSAPAWCFVFFWISLVLKLMD